eukprot:762181-Hanusia_phi.AAC.11
MRSSEKSIPSILRFGLLKMSSREKIARESFQDLTPILTNEEKNVLVQLFVKNDNRAMTDDSEIPRKIYQLAIAKGKPEIANRIANAFPAVKSFAAPPMYGQPAQSQRSTIPPAQQYRQPPAMPYQAPSTVHAPGFQQSHLGAVQSGGYQTPSPAGQLHHGLQPYQQQVGSSSAAMGNPPAAGQPHAAGLSHPPPADAPMPASQEAGKADDANAGKKDKANEAESTAKKGKDSSLELAEDILTNMDLEREQAVLESVYQYKPSSKFVCTDVPFLNYEKVDGDRSGPFINRLQQIIGGHEQTQAIQQVENTAIDLLSVACEMHLRTMFHRLLDLHHHRRGQQTLSLNFHQEPFCDVEPSCHANLEEQVRERRGVNAVSGQEDAAKQGGGGEEEGDEDARSGRRTIGLQDVLFLLEREVRDARLLLSSPDESVQPAGIGLETDPSPQLRSS